MQLHSQMYHRNVCRGKGKYSNRTTGLPSYYNVSMDTLHGTLQAVHQSHHYLHLLAFAQWIQSFYPP